jgi:hypothetical protein
MVLSTIPLRTLRDFRAHVYAISVSCDNHRCTRPDRHHWLDLDGLIAEHGADAGLEDIKVLLRCKACSTPRAVSIVADGKPKR